MNKVIASTIDAVKDIKDGASIAVGGFGTCGVPVDLIDALKDSSVRHLRIVSNNCGLDDFGLGILLSARQIDRMTSSYVGENQEFSRQYLSGELEVELVPQGTLAERLRAGGAGIPGFFTSAGVGTPSADGGIAWRYASDGSTVLASPAKEVRRFGDQSYVLEEAIQTDFALVRAAKGDRWGNLVFHAAARNFNPISAMASKVAIAEVEELVEPGEIDPDMVHLPGVFVQRLILASKDPTKRIEKLTVQEQATVIR